MSKIKWTRPAEDGVLSKDGRWLLQPSRDRNGKPVCWSVFDNNTNPEFLDDRLTEKPRLAEAKEYVEKLAAEE